MQDTAKQRNAMFQWRRTLSVNRFANSLPRSHDACKSPSMSAYRSKSDFTVDDT